MGIIDKFTYLAAKTAAKRYTNEKISELPKPLVWKDSVATYDDLPPLSSVDEGWMYTTIDTGKEWACKTDGGVKSWAEVGSSEPIVFNTPYNPSTNKAATMADIPDVSNKYEKPVGGIPSTDMTGEVQASLEKADTALQEHQDISGKVDKEQGKGLSTNDFTDNDKTKLDGIEAGAEVNDVISVAGKKGAVTLNKNDVGLGNVDNTSDLDKPISTDMQAALDGKASTGSVSAIEAKIPNQASAQNQLADKDFVNSSVATNTANYISNNGEPFTSIAQLEAYSRTVTNNDYAFVTGVDSDGNTYYDRYKATVNGSTVSWAKEFRLNNSSFTAA